MPPEPRIVFAANAYLKYLYMCHAKGGHTEVGGYGVHDLAGAFNNVIRVRDFVTVRQDVDPAFCSLDPAHANEVLAALCLADESFNPNQLMACWCHTHPGASVAPSGIDWDTFAGHDSADWAAMIILGKDGRIGAHVRMKHAMGTAIKEVAATVAWEDMATPEVASRIDPAAWAAEYEANIWPSARRFHPDLRPPSWGDDVFWGGWTAGRVGSGANAGRLIELPFGHDGNDDDEFWRYDVGADRRPAAREDHDGNGDGRAPAPQHPAG